jgi:general secretion pathway protein K
MPTDNHQGSAILSALFIMILVAIAATAMSLRLQIDINRTQLIQTTNTLKNAANAGETQAIQLLINNAHSYNKSYKQNIDSNLHLPPLLWGNDIKVKINITDLQSKFNINNLKNSEQLKNLTLLIKHIYPTLSPQQSFLITLQTQEWITKKNPNLINLSSATFYAKQKPPYLPSHKLLSSITEWRLVKGVSQKTYNQLSPYVTALPEKTTLNLNTAPSEILTSLSLMVKKSHIDNIIQARGKFGFKTLKEAMNNPLIKKLGLKEKELTLTSQYFLIKSHARNKENDLTLYTIVKRKISKEGILVSVIQQTLNTL